MSTDTLPATLTPDSLEFSRSFTAPPERLWRAWTDAREVEEWFGMPMFPCGKATIDLRVGGAWRFALEPADGSAPVAFFGEYREIVPHERLVLSWHMDGPDTVRDTLVTMEFRAQGNGGCELHVRHEGFTDAGRRDGHHLGWTTCLQTLDALLDEDD